MSKHIQGTLDFHLLAVIASLCGDRKPFSAHDITQRIRKRVNDGEIEITGRPYVQLAGVNTQIIEHVEVRDSVHRLFDAGQIPNVTRETHNSGQYLVYTPVAPTVPALPSTPPAGSTAPAPGAHPFFKSSDPTPAPVVTPPPFSAHSATPGSSSGPIPQSGIVNVSSITGVGSFGSGALPPARTTPVQSKVPATKALEHLIVQTDKPVIRLRLKATQQFLKIGSKTRWNRRCDLSQTRGYQQRVKPFVDSGEVEIVTI